MAGSKAMGKLLHRIRGGNTQAPPEFLGYIEPRGFDWKRAEAERERAWEANLASIKHIVEDLGKNVNVPLKGYAGVAGSKGMGDLLEHYAEV